MYGTCRQRRVRKEASCNIRAKCARRGFSELRRENGTGVPTGRVKV